MRKLWKKIVGFFLFSTDAPLWLRLMPYILMGLLTALIISGSVWAWDYTNSNEFCGTSCHTMPPQYSTYQRSPHARVECVECHLGRDSFTEQFPRKVGHSHTLYALIFHTYEYPIVAKQMRPANESCETCHFPEKFSDDSLREVRHYAPDEANTQSVTYLVMKTGGGTKRQGLGRGIHWHVENKVEFYSPDPFLQQEIPYVRVEDENGKVTEYVDLASGKTAADFQGEKLFRVDCITCHNRVTHNIPTPFEAVDQAFLKKLIPQDLPFVKQQAIALLTADHESIDQGIQSMDGLADYYAKNYPDLYAQRKADIDKSVETLKEIYPQLRYPEQELDWTSHPNNIGHKDSPGCFRCHDGKHLSSQNEAVRLECNVCHSIPVVGDPSQLTTDIEIGRGPEPPSHTLTTWMTLHGKVKDNSCLGCHPAKDSSMDLTALQGKPPSDGSFCGNSACHTSEWQYTGFRSPALTSFLDMQLSSLLQTPAPVSADAPKTYEGALKSVLDKTCTACHNSTSATAGLDLSSYAGVMKGGQSGAGIVANEPDSSVVYTKQAAGGHFGQLSDDEIILLKEWILAGAPEK